MPRLAGNEGLFITVVMAASARAGRSPPAAPLLPAIGLSHGFLSLELKL